MALLLLALAPIFPAAPASSQAAAAAELPAAAAEAHPAAPSASAARPGCMIWSRPVLERDPTEAELRCRYRTEGPGRFGLSVYMEVPVYQPATPLPGTHVVGLPALPGPHPGESFEEWEWRVHRTQFGRQALHVFRELELLDPVFAARLMDFEQNLRNAGVRFTRRETWRSPERQAFLFQQGRSRPGPIVTATLTSWHSAVDARGVPAAKAADYNVSRAQMQRFHEIAWATGLETYGPDSNDPGHVYLPGAEGFPADELVFLRLLNRVPVVTLSTGRPTDEPVSRAMREEFRTASFAWVSEPFVPHPLPRLAAALPSVEALAAPVETPSAELHVHRRTPPAGALGALVAWLSGRR